ncbi:MAG: hypothetical protein BBJ57_02075 [Desulfobacterales bacterium PC51MH44]|nr:MAG: hypothetical protein BBJ57_02075 [Desulfobacterales bacterium PC51MH44]
MAKENFFTNQTANGDSTILKRTGDDNFDDSEFQIKIGGVIDGATITPKYDFGDGDFQPLLDADGATVKTITALGIIEVLSKPGCSMKLTLSDVGGSTDITADRI